MADEQRLTESDLMEVLQFANMLYNNGLYGMFTPDLSNTNLVNLNNLNPNAPTAEKVNSALAKYTVNEEALQGYSEFMTAYDILYNRMVEYYSNMLSFDLDISCKNVKNPSEYNTEEYKKDLKRVYKFLDNFNYKHEFQKVLKELVRHEEDYVWLRDSEGTFTEGEIDLDETSKKRKSKYVLQTMPQQYCKKTALSEYGILYDFDMTYFTLGGVDIRSFDPIFKSYYKDVFDGKGKPKYEPTAQLNRRTGSYAMYHQTSMDNGAWCFKFDDSNMAVVPFLAPLIRGFLTNQEIEALQKDKDMISARAILAGEIQLMDKQKSGQVQDTTAYNMTTLVKLMKLVKAGLTKNINAVAMPTANPRLYQFSDNNPNMAITQLSNSVSQGLSASRLLYTYDKMTESEIKNAIVTDYNIVKKVYEQFNNFLDFFINKKTKKYKFRFNFSGSTYPFIREAEQQVLHDLMDKGVVLAPRTYAKTVGMTPMAFDALLEEGKMSGWTEELTSVLQTVYTQSGSEDKGKIGEGRPTKGDNEISDNGAESRESK